MNHRGDSWEGLDTEFDHFLLDMKPYVLKHPNKTGEILLHNICITVCNTNDDIPVQYHLYGKLLKTLPCLHDCFISK